MPTREFEAPSQDKQQLEAGSRFTPRFDDKGLINTVVTSADDGELLMVAYMNADALALSLETGIAHFWSRSRKTLWKKGETSGNLLQISEIRTDCDQDVLWLKVSVAGNGAACHTGRRSCFYRVVERDGQTLLAPED
ncbi:MAG: phosphoribosyl-AMP cyclohydrolase [Rhizobiaceae bacterium]